jgi:hypothetical protein
VHNEFHTARLRNEPGSARMRQLDGHSNAVVSRQQTRSLLQHMPVQAGRQTTVINAIWHKYNKLDWLALALQPVRVSSQLPTHSCTDISQIMNAVNDKGTARGKFERRILVEDPCFVACMFRIRFPAGIFKSRTFPLAS